MKINPLENIANPMSQLTTSMVNWLEDMSAEKLIKLELILKRVRAVKGLISQKERKSRVWMNYLLFPFLQLWVNPDRR